MEGSNPRDEIELLLEAGRSQDAARQLRVLWETKATAQLAAFVVPAFEKLRETLDLTPHRCALLRSFTIEPAIPLLRACAFTAGLDVRYHIGEFNTYAQ